VWIYTGNKLAKFHGNILSLSKNIAKSFRGGYFFDSHCIKIIDNDAADKIRFDSIFTIFALLRRKLNFQENQKQKLIF